MELNVQKRNINKTEEVCLLLLNVKQNIQIHYIIKLLLKAVNL